MQQLVVLHFQPIAEQDWLLDTFSLEQGRQKLMLKRPEYEPDLFIAYQGDWFKKTDWPTIKAWQLFNAWRLEGTELYCGLYLNELLVSLLPFQNHYLHYLKPTKTPCRHWQKSSGQSLG